MAVTKTHKELSDIAEKAIDWGLTRDPQFFNERSNGNVNTQRLWQALEKMYVLDKKESKALLDILMIKLYNEGLWKTL